jgi:aspartokinase/homoserine dehydrogenase 1
MSTGSVGAAPAATRDNRSLPPALRPTVHKFGGASLADGRAVAHALDLVRSGPRPAVVVVSALAGATDRLLAIARLLAGGREDEAASEARRLEQRYRSAAVAARAGRRVLAGIDASFEELAALARAPRFARELSPPALDAVLARGEWLAARIFAAGLEKRRVRSRYVDAVGLVVTDGKAGGAFPDLLTTARRIRAALGPLLARGVVPVLPGFVGSAPDGRVVTLGRGGSDMTAMLAGRAVHAREIRLWKDVPGFLTADPRVVPDARVIPQLNVREAAELAYYGARVLQPRALIPIMDGRVPVFVRPFGEPDRAGTEISRRRTLARYPVKALSAVPGQALVTVSGSGMLGVPGIAARTFGALQREGISVSLISQASSEHSICFSVPQPEAGAAKSELLREFAGEIRRGEIDDVEVVGGVATISVVGLGMAGTPGIAARVFAPLARSGINIVAIAQGSSELNISFVVRGSDAGEAQRRVHEAFRLSKIGGGAVSEPDRSDVVLLGFGSVGRTLAALVSRQKKTRLVAVADRSGVVFRPEGLSPRAVARLASAKLSGSRLSALPGGRAASGPAAVTGLAEHALSRPIFVDATAEETSGLLERAAAAGFDLVLANKRPLSGSRSDAARVQDAVRSHGRRLRFEATVGAGLPVIDTYWKLVESGDRVLRIDGCLSGTLGFLVTELERGRSFSETVRAAVERGYAEPDPREDLSGADVARKALILARLLGFAGEPRDVAVESLVPGSARRATRSGFLSSLEKFDAAWERRIASARSRSRVLRYVASVTRRRVRVGLRSLAPDSPFSGLKGSDNLVAFTTVRYRENPLVIRGPGAGLSVTAAGIFNDIALLAGS